MNKSYKVLFNRVRGVATAVSEIASSHQARKKATAVVVAVAMGMMAGSAMATTDTYYGTDTLGTMQWANSTVLSPGTTSFQNSVQSGFTQTWDGTKQATINFLFGGHSLNENVSSNEVTVTGGTTDTAIYGGYTMGGHISPIVSSR